MLTDYWAHSCSQQAYYTPVNHDRSSPRNPCTFGSLLIYRPLRDGWLSWPCWLTDSRRLNRKVVTHPASSLVQDRESLPAETSVLTTMLCRQHYTQYMWTHYMAKYPQVPQENLWKPRPFNTVPSLTMKAQARHVYSMTCWCVEEIWERCTC